MTEKSTSTTEADRRDGSALSDQLGPTVEDVFAKMRKHRPDWNAYGQSRDSAADLAARCALELAAEHTAVAVAIASAKRVKALDLREEVERLRSELAAERERCAAECRKLAAMWRSQDGNEKRAGVAEGCADTILGA